MRLIERLQCYYKSKVKNMDCNMAKEHFASTKGCLGYPTCVSQSSFFNFRTLGRSVTETSPGLRPSASSNLSITEIRGE